MIEPRIAGNRLGLSSETLAGQKYLGASADELHYLCFLFYCVLPKGLGSKVLPKKMNQMNKSIIL